MCRYLKTELSAARDFRYFISQLSSDFPEILWRLFPSNSPTGQVYINENSIKYAFCAKYSKLKLYDSLKLTDPIFIPDKSVR